MVNKRVPKAIPMICPTARIGAGVGVGVDVGKGMGVGDGNAGSMENITIWNPLLK